MPPHGCSHDGQSCAGQALQVRIPRLPLGCCKPLLLGAHAAVHLRPKGIVADIQAWGPLRDLHTMMRSSTFAARPVKNLKPLGSLSSSTTKDLHPGNSRFEAAWMGSRCDASAAAPPHGPSTCSYRSTVPLPIPARTLMPPVRASFVCPMRQTLALLAVPPPGCLLRSVLPGRPVRRSAVAR